MQRIDATARNYGQKPVGEKVEDHTVCPCGNSWFEEFKVSRVSKLHMVIPGQEVPKVGSGPFVLLRCVKCNEIFEPNLTAASTAHIKVYNELMSELRDPKEADKPEPVYPAVHPSAPAGVRREEINAADKEGMAEQTKQATEAQEKAKAKKAKKAAAKEE
jgi:hypothetical protein